MPDENKKSRWDYLGKEAEVEKEELERIQQKNLSIQEFAILEGHSKYVLSVAFAPRSRLLASGSGDSTVKLWDVAERKEIATLTGHKDEVFIVAFSPDGRFLSSVSKDRTIKLWDIVERKALSTFLGGSVTSIAFSPDSKLLASASKDYAPTLFDVTKRKKLSTFKYRPSYLVAFNQEGNLLAFGHEDSVSLSYTIYRLIIWNVREMKELPNLSRHVYCNLLHATLSSDWRFFASPIGNEFLGIPPSIVLQDLTERPSRVSHLKGHTKPIFSVAFNPDGKFLASGSEDETVRVWDIEKGRELCVLDAGRASTATKVNTVFSVAFSPDGRFLAAGCGNKKIRIWEVIYA